MASIDKLLEEIADPSLRREVRREVEHLKRNQRFGLVYEDHGETAALEGIPIQPGSMVERSDTASGTIYEVKAITKRGRTARIVDSAGNEEDCDLLHLLSHKRLGEPIFPALTSLGVLRKGGEGKPFHAVINGENYHTLQLLTHLVEGMVDCIYIDPPYNTGARDWKYSNRFVDSNDVWRHSKWLSMMEKRLRLAKRLLRPDGVLICTIDHNEVNHLGMLFESVFPEYLRYMITMVINPKGRDKANFAPVDEYVFFIVPNTGGDVILPAPFEPGRETQVSAELDEVDSDADEEVVSPEAQDDSQQWEYRHARRRGGGAERSSYREKRPDQFYPIYIDEKERRVVRVGKPIPPDAKPNFRKADGLRPLWPIDAEGTHRVWAYSPNSMQRLIDEGNVFLGKYHPKRNDWTLKYRVPRKTTRKLKTVWLGKAYDAGTHGTELLKNLLGQPGLFPFPKSVYAVRDTLAAVVRNKPDALVLDFFAGSGTTLHSLCLLNLEDDGRRRCILVTNNEVGEASDRNLRRDGYFPGDPEFERHGIFESVTRPRVEAVISGVRPDGKPIPGTHVWANRHPFAAGFKENVEFLRLEYLDPDEVEIGSQLNTVLPALWIASGGVGEREIPEEGAVFTMPEGSTYGVLFRASRFRQFKEALEKRPEVTRVWLVTDSEEAFAEMAATLPPQIEVSMLYRDYLRNFRINTGRTL
jgi:adenine-specific DNA-methyltransferase